ncbi:MAG: hypothetical protein V7K32_13990 [Nostoc sp.]|uniref:hypothetical protein n=1 Tax=Nostoc sp. TaxID=1180 RepID=UPI002FF8A774
MTLLSQIQQRRGRAVSSASQQQDLRLSYVIWQEGVDPFLVLVELLSPGTEQEDLGKTLPEVNRPPTKWEVYSGSRFSEVQ